MVRSNYEQLIRNGFLETRFPTETRVLRDLVEKSVPRSDEDRLRARKAFRDAGLFEALNEAREMEEQEPYERVSDVSWLEMAVCVEKRLSEDDQNRRVMDERRAARLSELARRDAEEELESEAVRLEGQGFEKFEPMSRGPEENRKWFKHVPYKYLPENKPSLKKGAPTEIQPEAYQRLKAERAEAIAELFAENLVKFRKELGIAWLRKKYEDPAISTETIARALDGEAVPKIRPADIARAWSAADAHMDTRAIMTQRNNATTVVDSQLGWRKIARKITKKPRDRTAKTTSRASSSLANKRQP